MTGSPSAAASGPARAPTSDASVAAPPFDESRQTWAPTGPDGVYTTQASTPYFNVWPLDDWVQDDAVEGYGWPLGAVVTLLIDDPDVAGPVNYSDSQTVIVAPWDPVETSVRFELEGAFDVQPGHVVKLIHDTTVKTHTVTNLAVTEVNPDADTVSGTAQPGADVDVWVHGGPACQTIVGPAGNWTADCSAVGLDIVPGTGGAARQHDEDGDGTIVYWQVPNPRFDVWALDDQVQGWEWPLGAEVTLLIDDPDVAGPVNYSDSQTVILAPWNPDQTWVLFDLQGVFDVQPGHIVTLTHGTTAKTHTVTNLAVTAVDPGADTVSGTADPFTEVYVDVCDETGCVNRHEVAGVGGGWTADFSVPGDEPGEEGTYDIGPGSQGNVYQHDDDADATGVHWRVPNPYFDVFAVDDQVQGWEWPLGAEVTLLIDDPDVGGPVNYSDSQTVILAPWDPDQTWVLFDFEGSFDVQPGHIVTLTDGATAKTHTVTNLAVTAVDPNADTVSGTAQPGADVDVWVHGGPTCQTTVEQDGDWTADCSAVGFDIVPGTGGRARQHDDDGDGTAVDWRVPNPTFNVWLTRNQVQGYQWPLGALVCLAIDDPGIPGTPDYSDCRTVGPAPWDPDQTFVNFDLPDGLEVQPGCIVTLTHGATVKTHTVTNLAVTAVDPNADTVSGAADPGTDVWSDICDESSCVNRYEVAGVGGGWTADFSVPGDEPGEEGTYDIGPGTQGQAYQYDGDGDATAVDWRVPNPRFGVWPNWGGVQGYEWPEGAEVTLTIDDPGTPNPVDYSDSQIAGYVPWYSGETWVGFDLRGRFHVQPGYIVTMADGATTKTHTVTDLAVTAVNPGADTVSGTAGPGADIWVNTWAEIGASRHEVAGGGGGWTADFSIPGDESFERNTFDIVPGSEGEAHQPDNDEDATNIYWTPGGTISGTVTDSGGSPILGIWVEACPFTGGGSCSGAWTAANGTYTTGLVAAGDYRVEASAPGYVREYYDDHLAWEDADPVPVTEGGDTPGINFGLRVEGTISGTVTDPGGGPIPGASLWACPFTGSGSCQSASTDSNGAYTIRGLATGTYRVEACATGYACEYYDNTLDWNAAIPITATEGADTPGINFSLRVEGTISGVVKDPDGNPIVGASLYAGPYTGSGSWVSGQTGPGGAYTIGGLATGDYRIQACATGYVCEYYDNTLDWNAAIPVTVTEGVDTPGINFSLRVEGTISGTVTDSGGSPILGAWVDACPFAAGFCQSASTESGGTYTIGGLATGDYRVGACAAGHACEYYDDTPDWDAATPVHVTEGDNTPDIDFSLGVEGTISGTVTGPGGTEIGGASVWACPFTGGGWCQWASSTSEGTYTIGSLATGDYNVQACATGYVCEYYDNTLDWSAATAVPVTEGADTPGIDFSLSVEGTICGTVTDAFGSEVEGAGVSAHHDAYDGAFFQLTSSQEDGSYVITGLPAGSYYVVAGPYPFAPSPPYVSEFYNGVRWPDEATLVEVTPGANICGIDFSLEMSGTISGVVSDVSGNPIEGASVCINPSDHQPPWWWGMFHCPSTDENGTYSNSGLATGSYIVWAGAGFYVTEYYDNVPTYEEATCVPVVEGSDTPNIDFSLFAADADADGCTDAQEAAMGFNSNAWYDFYDVPVPAYSDPTPNGTKSRAVNFQDVVGVLKYVGTKDNDPVNAAGVDYDSDKNGDTIEDGRDYDRSPGPLPNPPYDAGPPSGAVNFQDVVVVLNQVGLDCR